MASRVIYTNKGATRNRPLTPGLVSIVDYMARKVGVFAEVFSGGQPSSGPRRTGSHRHDDGKAGDVHLFEMVDGKKRYLEMDNPADAVRMAKFVELGAQAGLTGIGAGEHYMGKKGIHVGYGTPATWGGAPWVKAAYEKGVAERKGFDPSVINRPISPLADGSEIGLATGKTVANPVGLPMADVGPLAGRTLRKGMHGDDVAALQAGLNQHGAFLNPDSKFGPATAAAVRAYEIANGLTPDKGIAGREVKASLFGGPQISSITPPSGASMAPSVSPMQYGFGQFGSPNAPRPDNVGAPVASPIMGATASARGFNPSRFVDYPPSSPSNLQAAIAPYNSDAGPTRPSPNPGLNAGASADMQTNQITPNDLAAQNGGPAYQRMLAENRHPLQTAEAGAFGLPPQQPNMPAPIADNAKVRSAGRFPSVVPSNLANGSVRDPFRNLSPFDPIYRSDLTRGDGWDRNQAPAVYPPREKDKRDMEKAFDEWNDRPFGGYKGPLKATQASYIPPTVSPDKNISGYGSPRPHPGQTMVPSFSSRPSPAAFGNFGPPDVSREAPLPMAQSWLPHPGGLPLPPPIPDAVEAPVRNNRFAPKIAPAVASALAGPLGPLVARLLTQSKGGGAGKGSFAEPSASGFHPFGGFFANLFNPSSSGGSPQDVFNSYAEAHPNSSWNPFHDPSGTTNYGKG